MSDSQAYEEVTVESDGVTVIKRFEEDEFPVPAIAFEFECEREEAVTVTLTDSVPEGIEVEDLGFHPEYGSEYWTIDEETITFERELEAGASYTTVYGIRATGSDDVQQFLTEPTIASVDPPLSEEDTTSVEDVVPETDDTVVKDAITGDGEIPGLENEENESEDEDVGTLELNDPTGVETGDERSREDEGSEADEPENQGDDGGVVDVESGSLTAALAAEIRQQDISGEDLKLLRRALDVAAKNDGSTQAKVEQLQDDIADLRAYTGALEEFLDENGTGEQLIGEFEEELTSFENRLDSFESDIDANSSELESVSETVSEVDEDVEGLDQQVENVSDEVDAFEGDLEEMDDAIDDLQSSVEELEAQVTEGEFVERIEEIENQVDALQSWQEQIKQTFGG